FFTPSWQEGALQKLPSQTPLAQSEFAEQWRALSHEGQVPPQSTSVSLPFFEPSVQEPIWHTPPVHTALEHSAPEWRCQPSAHDGHAGPPQSTPVSAPFFAPSVHEAFWTSIVFDNGLHPLEATYRVQVPVEGSARLPVEDWCEAALARRTTLFFGSRTATQ